MGKNSRSNTAHGSSVGFFRHTRLFAALLFLACPSYDSSLSAYVVPFVMSAPSALTVVYPPSFQNSFWSYPSYRKGAQNLYAKLQAGLDENQSILAFVAHRAELEYTHAEALATPPPQASLSAPLFKQATGILSDVLGGGSDTASGIATRGYTANNSATSHAFRLVQAETMTSHANAHGKTARMLEQSVLEPFGKWALEHHERVHDSWQHVDHALKAFERQKGEVEKLRAGYEAKCRAADEAHDDVRFAPLEESSTASPLASPSKLRLPLQQPQRKVSGESVRSLDSDKQQEASNPETLKRRETLRKQFGFTQRATSGQLDATHEVAFAGVKLPPLPTETEGESLEPSIGLKRSGTISALVHSAVDKMPAPLKAAVGGVVSGEPRHARLRRDADNAERVYEEAVRNLDRTRCQVEEVLFQHYGLTQRWEMDRVRAVHSVLASYNKAIAAQLPALEQSVTRGAQVYQGLSPALELRAMIRDARTGPFQPAMERFQSYYHDDASSGLSKNGGFGLDLALVERLDILDKHDDSPTAQSSEPSTMPPVLEALLAALDRAYADDDRWAAESEDSEKSADVKGQAKRKTWVLEVPIGVTHRLRDALIAQLHPSPADLMYGSTTGTQDTPRAVSAKMLDTYDPPVLAACVKLWLLELQESLIPQELWDTVDAIYRAAAGQEREVLASTVVPAAEKTVETDDATPPTKKMVPRPRMDSATEEKIRTGVLQDLRVVLGKLPRIHLVCLDAIVAHLHRLVMSTTTATESDSVYLNKLGLALGRAVLRPPVETAYTLSAPNSTLVALDLIAHYDALLPGVLKKKRSDVNSSTRPAAPVRKRTKPVDQRISRSSIGSDLQQGAKKFMEQLDDREPHGTIAEPFNEPVLAAHSPIVADAPPTITTADLDVSQAKIADNANAPTPLNERVLSNTSTANTTIDAITPPKEAETMSVGGVDDQDRPLSNVARLSRQFNSANSGGGASDIGGGAAGRVRMGSSGGGGAAQGVVRGPRPAGARTARASGQFSS